MASILILVNDSVFSERLSKAVSGLGHHSVTLEDPDDALRMAALGTRFEVAVIDDKILQSGTLDLFGRLQSLPSQPELIVFSDNPTPDEAEQAIRAGAWDYMERPDRPGALTLALVRALEYRSRKKSDFNHEEARLDIKFDGIKGSTGEMQSCLETAIRAAKSDAPVLISGETGTGKEVFASAIHEKSARSHRNFVVVDCAALPANLVESTLFGHKKGAFTGADRDQDGLIKQANGGTLFLDEVGELPMEIQTSFLRVLEEKAFRPVGSSRVYSSDFRLISATNQNLENMAAEGRYRRDLIYRIRAFNILLPPLRRRMDDLEELADYHLKRIYQNYGLLPKELSSDFIATLKSYDWPGNIRELVNALEIAAVTAGEEPVLFSKHLPMAIRVSMARDKVDGDEKEDSPERNPAGHPLDAPVTLQEARDAAIDRTEKEYLNNLIALTEGDMKKAISISGLSRSRLYALLKKHDISTRQ